VEMLRSVEHQNMKFIFLGKSDSSKPEVTAFKAQLQELGRLEQFVFFDDFIAPELFDAYLSQTDFLCPLIHPHTPSAEQYISNQISGAFNIAYSYRIPMLIHNHYREVADLGMSSFFYETAGFQQALQEAMIHRDAKILEISAVEKWQKDYQQEKFLAFIL